MVRLTGNDFELFGLPARFGIDAAELDRAYRALQGKVHPDRFAAGTDAERRVAMQSAARVNEAYRTLKDPVARATRLLALQGVTAGDDTDTGLDFDFLERQLERRERASDALDARDERTLASLYDQVRSEMADREAVLRRLLDDERAWDRARDAVRELRFLAKIASDLDAMIADVEA